MLKELAEEKQRVKDYEDHYKALDPPKWTRAAYNWKKKTDAEEKAKAIALLRANLGGEREH